METKGKKSYSCQGPKLSLAFHCSLYSDPTPTQCQSAQGSESTRSVFPLSPG